MVIDDKINAPVFIFSAGWRSGSTLVQRLLCSSKKIIVWGESGGALSDFSNAFVRYQQMLGPGGQRFKYGYGGNGADQFQRYISASLGEDEWIACMNSDEDNIYRAIKTAINTIYRDPAVNNGFSRWGVKEVLADVQTATFLKMLYPEALFIFLVRHPFDCVSSIKQRKWMDLPPGRDPIEYFGGIWRDLAQEFRLCEFGLKIRYEDLVDRSSVIQQIRGYINIDNITDDFVNRSKVNWNSVDDSKLGFFERRRLKSIVAEEMQQWKY